MLNIEDNAILEWLSDEINKRIDERLNNQKKKN